MATTRTHGRADQDRPVERVELAVARLLRIGTTVAALLMAAGLAVLLLDPAVSLGPALVTTGLITLVCTPLLRVVAALLIYLQEGDLTYAVISLTVLAVVCAGIILGQTH